MASHDEPTDLPAAYVEPQYCSSRPHPNFPPSIWGNQFVAGPSHKQIEMLNNYIKEIETLKEEAKEMLMNDALTSSEKMSVINSLHRLGVSYHFEKEIDEELNKIFDVLVHASAASPDIVEEENHLHTTSLQFRVFREHGYYMSCDIFKQFMDSNGEFKEMITSDPRGMLSLYEAAHLRLRGEDILDKALAFTSSHLKSIAPYLSPHLAKQVTKALHQPFHLGIPRLEARHYISTYEEDESHSELLLRFAKLDFNRIQLLHQQELSIVSRWWWDLELSRKLSYARERVVECFLLAASVYFEPQYSSGRIMLTKLMSMLSVFDDTYDSYGTPQELQLLTDAVNRWDASAVNQLPDDIGFFYSVILNLYDEIDEQMTKEGRSYGAYQAKEALKNTVVSYDVEAKWSSSGYVPKFEEYMANALVSIGYVMVLASSFMGMGEMADVEAFDWLMRRPNIVRASEAVARLMNDIVSAHGEKQRGDVASGIECYMKEYGVSEQVSLKEFQKMLADAWKDMTEQCLRPTVVPMPLLVRVVNLARVSYVIYQYDDGYNNPAVLKDYITSLFINPVPIT